jgi:hypothetical protein
MFWCDVDERSIWINVLMWRRWETLITNASLIYITSKHWLQTLLSSTSHHNIDYKRFSHLRHIKTLSKLNIRFSPNIVNFSEFNLSKPNTCIFRTKVLVRKVFSLDWFHCMYIYVLIQLFLSCLISCINCINTRLKRLIVIPFTQLIRHDTRFTQDFGLLRVRIRLIQMLLSSTSHQNIDYQRFSHLRHIKTLIQMLLSSTSHQNIDSNVSLIYITSKPWLQTLLSSGTFVINVLMWCRWEKRL